MLRKTKKLVRIALIVLLLLIFSFSLYQIISTICHYSESEESYKDIVANVVTIKDADDINEQEGEKIEQAPIAVDFNALLSQNKDVVGWLYCENTPVNYPIVQSDDNDYYLRRMLNGKYNIAGTVFMDYRCHSDYSSLNTIIYGHNMKNDSMFGTFTDYKSQEYYDEHPIIWLLTPEVNYKIELMAGYVTPSDSDAYSEFVSQEELYEYIQEAKKKSTFFSPLTCSSEDRIVTLSTCSYEYDAARYVLVGKLSSLQDE